MEMKINYQNGSEKEIFSNLLNTKTYEDIALSLFEWQEVTKGEEVISIAVGGANIEVTNRTIKINGTYIKNRMNIGIKSEGVSLELLTREVRKAIIKNSLKVICRDGEEYQGLRYINETDSLCSVVETMGEWNDIIWIPILKMIVSYLDGQVKFYTGQHLDFTVSINDKDGIRNAVQSYEKNI